MAAARRGVQEACSAVVSPHEPRGGVEAGACPALLGGRVVRPRARLRHRPRLDRLLVEARARLVARPACHGGEAEMAVVTLDCDEPAEKPQPFRQQRRVVERRTRRDPRLGEPRVLVREPCLGPGPARVRRGSAQPADGTVQQLGRRPVARARGEDLDRAQHRGRIRAGRRGREARRPDEARRGEAPGRGRAAARRGRPERPERASVRVVRAELVEPRVVVRPRAAVAEPSVRALRVDEERDADRLEAPQPDRPGRRLPQHGHERPGDVVGAVAAAAVRGGSGGVLGDAVRVGEPLEVLEGRCGEPHGTAPAGLAIRAQSLV